MCGIFGVISNSYRIGPEQLDQLNDTMFKRGPDGRGAFWDGKVGLAMRRLAIIDIAGGAQPMYSEDDQVVVVMNGEIYNHHRLRDELISAGHRFCSRADTEVLVHGYERWGIDGLLDRLDGMFAFAILDRSRRKVYLARDRFGEKPLYLVRDGDVVAFGSSLLATSAVMRSTPPVDVAALQYYWALHYVPGDRTIFSGVRRLQPAEGYELDADDGAELRRWRYWKLEEQGDIDTSAADFLEMLERSVQSRLIADVPVGIMLSGGLDSSLITALAARTAPGIHTFSVGFDSAEHDESQYASEVARLVGAEHHPVVFQQEHFRSLIPAVVESMDEPIGDQAMLPLYVLSELAASDVKVVLSGEGADELFAGYDYYDQGSGVSSRAWRRLRAMATSSRRGPSLFSDEGHTQSGFPVVLAPSERAQLSAMTAGETRAWHGELVDELSHTLNPLRRATLCDIVTWLSEDLLMKFDRMTMAHSIEGRAPYLQPRLAQAAFALPTDAKRQDGEAKVRLREVATGILPQSILQRPKKGWVLPMDTWLREDLHDEFIDSVRACPEPIIDRGAIEQLVRADRSKLGPHLGGRALYAILVMVRWLDYAHRWSDTLRSELKPDRAIHLN
jgi:asparagine synthase (glutamine-hydrolysing)